ncbi:MAG: hypothetical protein ABI789_04585 [Usitatibacter sp.]
MIGRRIAIGAACAAVTAAFAHGFGQRYDLPLPLSLYLVGAALTVAVSCVMLVAFVRAAPKDGRFPHIDLLAHAPARALASTPVLAAVRLAGVALFVLVIVAGFAGNPSPFRNIVPITVWALWWVGLAYFSALIGDVWKVANPLDTLFAAAERAYSRLRGGKRLCLEWTAPPWLQAWPAVVLYLAFLWMEMVWEGSDSPARIAAAIVAYSALTWAGMGLFGREVWLERGEVFSRVFGTLARFSPTHVRIEDRRVVEWHLRPPAVGLLESHPVDASGMMLVITILAAVSFDGFLETPAWASLAAALTGGDEPTSWPRTLGLIAAPLLFLGVYLFFCRLIAICGGLPRSRRIAGLFVLTLVPIAIAYFIAHYLSFLAMAGQYLVPLASDPLGRGWDLFGTANYFVRMGMVDARAVWIISVGAIVAGHIAALYLGHLLSMREFAHRRSAALSQVPMLVLMVAYTMLSLWIIAQPIVSNRG